MKSITREMIKVYNIKKVGCDFMGYTFKSTESLSFHHLIVPVRKGGKEFIQNGAVLNGLTSHPYLHLIEFKDPEIFYRITSEMIDENIKGKIDIENLKHIRDLLLYFEKEHADDTTKKGKRLIKWEYRNERIDL